jgi:hypothetical protein
MKMDKGTILKFVSGKQLKIRNGLNCLICMPNGGFVFIMLNISVTLLRACQSKIQLNIKATAHANST